MSAVPSSGGFDHASEVTLDKSAIVMSPIATPNISLRQKATCQPLCTGVAVLLGEGGNAACVSTSHANFKLPTG